MLVPSVKFSAFLASRQVFFIHSFANLICHVLFSYTRKYIVCFSHNIKAQLKLFDLSLTDKILLHNVSVVGQNCIQRNFRLMSTNLAFIFIFWSASNGFTKLYTRDKARDYQWCVRRVEEEWCIHQCLMCKCVWVVRLIFKEGRKSQEGGSSKYWLRYMKLLFLLSWLVWRVWTVSVVMVTWWQGSWRRVTKSFCIMSVCVCVSSDDLIVYITSIPFCF